MWCNKNFLLFTTMIAWKRDKSCCSTTVKWQRSVLLTIWASFASFPGKMSFADWLPERYHPRLQQYVLQHKQKRNEILHACTSDISYVMSQYVIYLIHFVFIIVYQICNFSESRKGTKIKTRYYTMYHLCLNMLQQSDLSCFCYG